MLTCIPWQITLEVSECLKSQLYYEGQAKLKIVFEKKLKEEFKQKWLKTLTLHKSDMYV